MHFGYWDATTRTHAEALLNMNRLLADRIELRPGENVLDAGCGVGGSSLWLAEHREAQVVGITIVDSQLARARSYAAARGLTGRVRFEHADYTQTRFPAGSFDVVWALESVCYAPETLAFYHEAARLLRPGGRLVLADGMRRRRPLDRTDERLLRRWADGWAVPDLKTGHEHVEAATAAGLTKLRLEDISDNGRRSMWHMVRVVSRDVPRNLARRALGRRSRIQQANTNAVFPLLLLALRDGCFYGLLSAEKPE